jgi:hypothetical protein
MIILLAFHCRDPRKSMLDPAMRDIYSNRLLFYCALGGLVLLVPTLYIPGLNTQARF